MGIKLASPLGLLQFPPAMPVIDDSLMLDLEFNEPFGPIAFNSAGITYHGQLKPEWPKNAPQRKPIFPGFYLKFDGKGGYVLVAGFGQDAPINEITVEVRARPATVSGQHDLFWLITKQNGRISVHMVWNDKIYWQFGAPFKSITCIFDPAWVGEWATYSFIASVKGGYMKFLRDNVLLAQSAGVPAFIREPVDFFVGGRPNYSFEGDMKYIKVYNKA